MHCSTPLYSLIGCQGVSTSYLQSPLVGGQRERGCQEEFIADPELLENGQVR
jgi:hypothetical protein